MQWNRLQTSVHFHRGLHTLIFLAVFSHGRKCSLWVSGEGYFVILLHSGELPSNLFIPPVLVCWGARGALELHWVSPIWLLYSMGSPSPCPLFPFPFLFLLGPYPCVFSAEGGSGEEGWLRLFHHEWTLGSFISYSSKSISPQLFQWKKIHMFCSCRALDFSVVSHIVKSHQFIVFLIVAYHLSTLLYSELWPERKEW